MHFFTLLATVVALTASGVMAKDPPPPKPPSPLEPQQHNPFRHHGGGTVPYDSRAKHALAAAKESLLVRYHEDGPLLGAKATARTPRGYKAKARRATTSLSPSASSTSASSTSSSSTASSSTASSSTASSSTTSKHTRPTLSHRSVTFVKKARQTGEDAILVLPTEIPTIVVEPETVTLTKTMTVVKVITATPFNTIMHKRATDVFTPGSETAPTATATATPAFPTADTNDVASILASIWGVETVGSAPATTAAPSTTSSPWWDILGIHTTVTVGTHVLDMASVVSVAAEKGYIKTVAPMGSGVVDRILDDNEEE